MPNIFISYRRDDTGGTAGRLAAELSRRFGKARVFVDIDAIPAGVNFEESISHALDSCQVALVLIGDRWLTAIQPDGSRRLDGEGDYVRMEVATALDRQAVTVVPVLVEDARMPSVDELPPDLAPLATQNAASLSGKRWRYDLGLLLDVIQKQDSRRRRLLTHAPRWTKPAAILAAVAILAVIALLAIKPFSRSQQLALSPATVPPVGGECSQPLEQTVDGSVRPLSCGKKVNSVAWQDIASNGNPLVMALGQRATPTQVGQALCSDYKTNKNLDTSQLENAYQLSALYYGWNFALNPFALLQQHSFAEC